MTRTLVASRPDGTFLRAQIEGLAGAPWIVFSNSVMTDTRIWQAQVEALADRFRLLRYDQRGHGMSSVSSGPIDFDVYGADLLAVLDAAEVASCTFIGLSMGAPTGLAAYAQAPNRFNGFAVVDGIARSGGGRAAFWAEQREIARTGGMAALADGTAARWMPGSDATDVTRKTLAAMIADTPVEGFATATYALANYDYSAVIPTMDCAFAGFAGAEDGSMPDTIRQQFGEVRGALFHSIADAGHVPNFQKPDEFNAALLSFLDDAAAASTKEFA